MEPPIQATLPPFPRSLIAGAKARSRRWAQAIFLLTAVVVLLLSGLWADQWWVQKNDQQLRGQLLADAVALARAVNPERVHTLAFDASDTQRPAFTRLRSQFEAYQGIAGVRGLYTLAEREGAYVFGPESYLDGDPQASPPGTRYEKPPEGLGALFREARAFTVGPYVDEYGHFVSALAPVLDPLTGDVVMAVGLDIEAGDWAARLAESRSRVWLAALSLVAIVLVGWSVLLSRDSARPGWRWRLRNVEAWLVLFLGLTMTLIATLTLESLEARTQHGQFALLAEAKAQRVVQQFHALRDHQFQALADGLEQLDTLDERAFSGLSRSLLGKHHVAGIGWAPWVSVEARTGFEGGVQRVETAEFQLFELDAEGARQPLADRPLYFPLRFVLPALYQPLLGFDLASEPRRRAAIEELQRTGLMTASERVPTADAGDDVVFVFAAVPHAAGTPMPIVAAAERPLRGIVAMALRLTSLLDSMVMLEHLTQDLVWVELHQLTTGAAPEWLASSFGRPDPQADALATQWPASDRFNWVQPLFVFGQAYALRVQATPEYRAENPLHMSWTVGILGTLLTLLSAILVTFQTQRRARLETEVAARTAELSQSETRYRQVVDNIREIAFQIDGKGNLVFLNLAWEQVTGFPVAESLGTAFLDYVHPDDREVQAAFLAARLEPELEHRHEQFRCRCRDGSYRWLEIAARPVQDAQGRTIGTFGTLDDVTERRSEEQAIRQMAFHDPLTGLPNRRLFLDRLQQALAASRRDRYHGALLFMDLDRFKRLNDTLGHEQGDVLLREIARRLREDVRQSDTVARFGGDEFVVIIAPLSPLREQADAQIRQVGEKLRVALAVPVDLNTGAFTITPSIGATLFYGSQATIPTLLQQADSAMYAAKAAGGNRFQLHTAS